MRSFSLPFTTAVAGGALLFLLVLVPVLLVQYRRYGRPSIRRVLAVSAVCVYGVALVAYTFLPLPEMTSNCGPRGGTRRQLVPFQFVTDVLRETEGLGLAQTLTSTVTLQVVFNVALFVPFGLLVRRFGGRSLAMTTLLGLLVSLAIELTQGSALWGLYECSYRVADVDDLFTNTLGGLAGAVLAPRFLAWLPMPAQLTASRLEPARVTAVRRWLSMITDLFVYAVTAAVLAFVGRVLAQLLKEPAALRGEPASALPPLIAGVLVFVLPRLCGDGASIGQRLLWLRLSWPGRVTLWRRLMTSAVGLAWASSFTLGALVDPEGPGQLVALGLSLPGLASPIAILFTKNRRGLSLALAGADITDSRTRPLPGEDPEHAEVVAGGGP